MERKWKEGTSAMQAAVLSRMMTICSYAETVQDANWMKEDATSGGLLRKRSRRCRMCSGSGYAFAIVVAVGLLCCCLSMQA